MSHSIIKTDLSRLIEECGNAGVITTIPKGYYSAAEFAENDPISRTVTTWRRLLNNEVKRKKMKSVLVKIGKCYTNYYGR